MDVASKYTELTGIDITDSNKARIHASITRTQAILEDLLGYSLDPDARETNFLDGVTPTFAYRLFPYRKADKFKHIDPCTEIHDIKIIKNGEVEETLDADEYNVVKDPKGFIKYFVLHNNDYLCGCPPRDFDCPHTNYEFAVDADYLFENDEQFPNDLMLVWADMVTYNANPKKDIKSETLGSHSYTRDTGESPETLSANEKIIRKYAGPKGSIVRNITF